MAQTLAQLQDTTTTMNQTIIRYIQGTSVPKEPKHQEVLEDIWQSSRPMNTADHHGDGGGDAAVVSAIVKSLKFQGDIHRESSIPEAYKATFEWIFAEPPSTDSVPLWSSFTDWLESPSQDIYWITGKPGAGKSTLMKFVTSHPRTISSLNNWAGSQPLLIATFYFWNAGTSLQKTQVGLFRTLLWQCLAKMPAMAPEVCPRRWAYYKIFGKDAFQTSPEWSWTELLETFMLMLPFVGASFDLAIFIDGLDEFEGAHPKLIELVNFFGAQKGVKVCVSSRPWNVFSDAFLRTPSLRMEDITSSDIKLFVETRFHEIQGFKELEQVRPQDARMLISGIVTKAQGVFLWVSVVVNTLCEGLTEGDKLSDLQDELQRLPSDLSELYSSIWLGVKGKYRAHSSQLFQILGCATQPLDAAALYMADDDKALDRLNKDFTSKDVQHMRQTIKRRLNSRTRGLLEVSKDDEVDYLHRSVRDWTVKIWHEIKAASPDFDPHLALLKPSTIELFQIRTWKNSLLTSPTEFWTHACMCLYHASNVKGNPKGIQLLVKALGQVECSLVRTGKSYTLPNGSLTIHGNTDPANLPLQTHEKSLHGTSAPGISTNYSRHVSFTGLAAQFAILHYIKHTLKNQPGLLITDATEVPIIECAIFGFTHFCGEDITGSSDQYARSCRETRLELVKYLIDEGGLRQPNSKSGLPGLEDYPNELMETVSQKTSYLASISDADPNELQYWKGVSQLLQEGMADGGQTPTAKKPLSGRLRTLFTRIPHTRRF